jgi:hypothetical protein
VLLFDSKEIKLISGREEVFDPVPGLADYASNKNANWHVNLLVCLQQLTLSFSVFCLQLELL